jgi:pSer/pThr/pTyr-binding forkhead associated (FHA) protein
MQNSWSDIGVEWVLLGLRIAFIAALYIFLMQIARLMLREIRAIGQPASIRPTLPTERAAQDERGLIVIDPGETNLQIGAYVPIAGEIVLGRGGASDLVLTDPFISTEHAEIVVQQDRTVLFDLGSTNGSRVNGEPVQTEVTLYDGDVVQLGNVRLRYAATVHNDGTR